MALTSDFNPTAPNVTYARMRQLLAESGGGLQEGVVGATDLKVAQRGAGANQSVDVPAGAAWVQVDTGTRNGLAHVYSDATANVAVTASNATNPRIDSIILRYSDSSIPTGSGSTPTLEVLTGTATAGATLDNRTGAAALPNDCLRLADILVPAVSTSVVTANIRDRRPWARGAYFRVQRTSGDITPITSATPVALDGPNFGQRVECSGAPIRCSLRGTAYHSVALSVVEFRNAIDSGGTGPSFTLRPQVAGVRYGVILDSTIIGITPGSHIIQPFVFTSASTATVEGTATYPVEWEIEEIVRPSATNT